MLTGIETGYEGKYDFPQRAEGPERTYMLRSAFAPAVRSTGMTP